jgi:hypothetical protein
MVAARDVVIIGSYPPMPGPATAATLGAVRRAWSSGWSVRVVSYRTGAADISVPVAGPLAGWRVEQIRRHFGGRSHLVLIVQSGAPFSDLGLPQQAATASGLAIAARRFESFTLVVGEDPDISPVCFRALARWCDECIAATDESARALEGRYRLAPKSVTVQEVEPFPSYPAGVEDVDCGLYRPGAIRALTVVELPTTTLAQRVRARARAPKSMLLRRLRGH